MQVTVDQDRCCGSGQCVLTTPTVFDQDENDGLVQVLDPEPDPTQHPAVRLAAALCPGRAITLTDAQP